MKIHSIGVPVLTLLVLPGLLSAQRASASNDGDWPMFLHDLAGTRYSPLNQINTGNVATLSQVWTYNFEREGKTIQGLSPTELYQEITPIVVNDVMYLPSGASNCRVVR